MCLTKSNSGVTGCLFLVLLAHVQIKCHGQNATTFDVVEHATNVSDNANSHDIDFETLSMFGVSHEFAEQFRVNLIKAIEAVKDEVDPLRQGEFGGVSGGYFQGGGNGGGGGGGGVEEDEEDEDAAPGTPGPGAFGVLSGLFGIFSGLGSLNPTRIIQSTVNFFPPGQRMQAQMIVDSLIGYTPPENRTFRPRPRTRPPRITTPMTITDAMMKEVTSSSSGNGTKVVSKGGDGERMPSSVDAAMEEAEVIAAEPEPTTTVNVYELFRRSTTLEPPQNEDDETDLEKRLSVATTKPKSNSSIATYKVKEKVQENAALEIRGVSEEMQLNATLTASTNDSSTEPIMSTEKVPSISTSIGVPSHSSTTELPSSSIPTSF